METLCIFGAGGHAQVVLDIIQQRPGFNRNEIAGFIAPERVVGQSLFGYPVIDEAVVAERKINSGIIAIGDNILRRTLVDRLKTLYPDFKFKTFIHPGAQIAQNVQIGLGSVIMAGAVVNPGSRIGDHCIINTSATLDHDVVLEDFSSIGPGAVLGGAVRVGSGSFVGLGASVIQCLRIGQNVLVGAGSLVLTDIADDALVYGSPATFVRSREKTESFFKSASDKPTD